MWRGLLKRTSPRWNVGAIAACSASVDARERSAIGCLGRNASLSSRTVAAGSAQLAVLKTTTREKPMRHTSAVVHERAKRKSHGSSSPASGSTSGGGSRGVACASDLRRAKDGSSVRAPRGVRSEALVGRAIRACAGLRFDWIMVLGGALSSPCAVLLPAGYAHARDTLCATPTVVVATLCSCECRAVAEPC